MAQTVPRRLHLFPYTRHHTIHILRRTASRNRRTRANPLQVRQLELRKKSGIRLQQHPEIPVRNHRTVFQCPQRKDHRPQHTRRLLLHPPYRRVHTPDRRHASYQRIAEKKNRHPGSGRLFCGYFFRRCRKPVLLTGLLLSAELLFL